MPELFLDDTLVSGRQLPAAMGVSRSTVFNWKVAGYVFEFGGLTTPGHCKAWLRDRAESVQPKEIGIKSIAAHAGPDHGPSWQPAADYFRLLFATHLEYSSPMEPEYFEISFSKGRAGEYFKVYVQLNLEDKTLLQLGGSVELRTRAIVRRAGILYLLPVGVDEDWPLSGRILENGDRSSWNGRTEPTIATHGRKVWIVNDGVK